MILSEAFHVLKCRYQSVKFRSIYFIICGQELAFFGSVTVVALDQFFAKMTGLVNSF